MSPAAEQEECSIIKVVHPASASLSSASVSSSRFLRVQLIRCKSRCRILKGSQAATTANLLYQLATHHLEANKRNCSVHQLIFGTRPVCSSREHILLFSMLGGDGGDFRSLARWMDGAEVHSNRVAICVRFIYKYNNILGTIVPNYSLWEFIIIIILLLCYSVVKHKLFACHDHNNCLSAAAQCICTCSCSVASSTTPWRIDKKMGSTVKKIPAAFVFLHINIIK